MTSPDPNTVVHTERVLSASPDQVYAAFADASALAQWWGPSGFTNTFKQFDFTPGGRWVFTMHAPNGANFHNESLFQELVPGSRIVLEHVVQPWFRLTVALTAQGAQTHLSWHQQFENPEIAAKMRELSTTANEQVLDRLEAVLAGRPVEG